MIYNNVFLTDLDLLAVQLMPTKWRKAIHIAFLRVLIYPFKLQFKRLKVNREKNIYFLSHDSRVGNVEKVLNDRFDVIERRIRIGAGNRLKSLYLYTKAEPRQTYLPKIIFTQAEVVKKNIDFSVLVPASLGLPASELELMKYLVEKYTDKDKEHKIEIV